MKAGLCAQLLPCTINCIQKTSFVHQIVYHSSHKSHHSKAFPHFMVPSSGSEKQLLLILKALTAGGRRICRNEYHIYFTSRTQTFIRVLIRLEVTHDLR
jgi:hypothetical protein